MVEPDAQGRIWLPTAEEWISAADLPTPGATLVDMNGIADLLQVERETAQQWRYRAQIVAPDATPRRAPLPKEDINISGKPLWSVDTIVAWAKRTKRWPPGTAADTEGKHRTPRRSARAGRQGYIAPIPPVPFSHAQLT
jgi:hypothetical protein